MNQEPSRHSVQELAEFLRDVAYAEGAFHHTDHSLFISGAGDGGLVYDGSLRTHSRVEKPLHSFALDFQFTESRGLYDITATKDAEAIPVAGELAFDQFKAFAQELFQVEKLYRPPMGHPIVNKSKQARNVPALQDLVRYMASFCGDGECASHIVDWTMYVVHPKDYNGDISYSGGLWTHSDLGAPRPKPYHSLSFSYSQTRGIHAVEAWKDSCSVLQREKMTFEVFKDYARRLFECGGRL